MKTCTECGKSKEPSEFYVNRAAEDGLTYKCKVCTNAYAKARRDAANASRPADWKKKTSDMAVYRKQWKQANPGYITEYMKQWYAKNKDRQRVRERVKYAVKVGKLVKLPCLVCGSLEVEAHHADYSRPLDVIWLCKPHHREVHSM